MGLVHVTEENFEQEVLNSEKPVLADFWAQWCGPCLMIGPIVEEVANEYGEKMKVVKVDVDQSQQVASKYGIMSIPTLIFFKGGQPVDQIIGAVDKGQLVSKINENL